MIYFRNLSTKTVLNLSESDLWHENTKALTQLRRWIGEQMLKMTTVIENLQENDDCVRMLKEEKFKLATKRALIDKIKNEY
ncbi:hypothetical protein [Emticicia sp.]|uniref:hypothetical protein n=1 Tax=Emticicia sp. TaxID=1930953 RepID=UPI00375265DA